MKKKIQIISAFLVMAIWISLAGFAWLQPAKQISAAERRPLAQLPSFGDGTADKPFTDLFDKYTQDQFPLRDTFRQLKSLFQFYTMQQMDNNNYYAVDGFVAKMLQMGKNQENQLLLNLDIFNNIYNKYLRPFGCKTYVAIVPDKGYYMYEESGHLAPDYEKLFNLIKEKMPWATHIDLTQLLTLEDFYKTDTHWRQENLVKVAEKIAEAMKTKVTPFEKYTMELIEKPFYGVYYGHAALPLPAEKMYHMHSEILDACAVYKLEPVVDENGKLTMEFAWTTEPSPVYDLSQLDSEDMYNSFISPNTVGMLRIVNPNATTGKNLIVFRDSFGSSISPLLVESYATVTLVDLRYADSEGLGNYLNFRGDDVLFLFGTQVLLETPLK